MVCAISFSDFISGTQRAAMSTPAVHPRDRPRDLDETGVVTTLASVSGQLSGHQPRVT